MGTVVMFDGLTKTMGGKRGGSAGVITGDGIGVEGSDRLEGGWRGVWGRGTKPAARMFGETIHLASIAPMEWRANWAGDRVGRVLTCCCLSEG